MHLSMYDMLTWHKYGAAVCLLVATEPLVDLSKYHHYRRVDALSHLCGKVFKLAHAADPADKDLQKQR